MGEEEEEAQRMSFFETEYFSVFFRWRCNCKSVCLFHVTLPLILTLQECLCFFTLQECIVPCDTAKVLLKYVKLF